MLPKEFLVLPSKMQNEVVEGYFKLLRQKHLQLLLKRGMDILISSLLLLLLIPIFTLVGLLVLLDSPGGMLFKQERITQLGRPFIIYKFRTMQAGAHRMGSLTQKSDDRITRVGKFLRKTRFDELPQLWNVLKGDMSLVGPRPEVPEFVAHYTPEMLATLLLPAGLTSPAAICFAQEEDLLIGVDIERIYIEKILPEKAKLNLDYLCELSLLTDGRIIILTCLRWIFPSG